MDLGLKIEFDPNHERGILQLPISPDWPFEQISCGIVISFGVLRLDMNVKGLTMGPFATSERPGIGRFVVLLLAVNGISAVLFALFRY
jgi:hypothetical protein